MVQDILYVSQYMQQWLQTILVFHSDSTQKWLRFIAHKLDIVVQCKGGNTKKKNRLLINCIRQGLNVWMHKQKSKKLKEMWLIQQKDKKHFIDLTEQ